MNNQIIIFILIVFFIILISIQYSINKIIVILKKISDQLSIISMKSK
ncbi:hypothetical protein [Helicovermis profundi]|uniref:ATP synthase F0 subunit 8 n=1 Tax=Helicovermis profundi TaxID=3065157 RepID=A0AAU9ENM7_9FIRM|nr:hypothetical protein HLPR_03910 [Clostridia bacterium S502]